MLDFKPFKSLRPTAEKIEQVSAKSTDFDSIDDLVDGLRENPNSFLHVTKGHLQLEGSLQEPHQLLPFARKYIDRLIEEKVLIKEAEPCFYEYIQHQPNGKVYQGIVGLINIAAYKENKVKKHEAVRPSKIGFLVELLKTTRVLGEPILMAFEGKHQLDYQTDEDLFDFYSPDKKRHIIKKITNLETISHIQNTVNSMDAVYIADGHHRSASMAEFHHKHPEFDNGYKLIYLLNENQFTIESFHRLIKPLGTFDEEGLVVQLSQKFEIFPSDMPVLNPPNPSEFGCYLKGKWYRLIYKHKHHLSGVELLEKEVVKEIFHIENSATDSSITFLPEARGEKALTQMIDDQLYEVAFTVNRMTFAQIRKVADENKILPPKSTYIEPKIRAGLLIQEM